MVKKRIPEGKTTTAQHDELQRRAAEKRKRDDRIKKRKGQSLRAQADAAHGPRYDMLTRERKMAIASDFVANHYCVRATCRVSGIGLSTMWKLRFRDPEFNTMVQALDADFQKTSTATLEEVKQEMTNIIRANIANYYAMNDDGDLFLDFSNCTPAQMAAIRSMSSEEHFEEAAEQDADGGEVKKVYVRVRKPQITLHNKTEALKLLGMHFKMFDQGAPSGGGIGGSAPDSAPPPALNIKFLPEPEAKNEA